MAEENKAYVSLALKWRPQKFQEMVGQEAISDNLENAVARGEISPAYLFSGPRGVGKTSMARILAKALNCQKGITPEPCGQCSHCRAIAAGSDMDVMEIDGATYTGIDSVRELQEGISHLPYAARKKVYIIDEVHMLSVAAFNALLKTLEEPPPFVVFVFATTEPEKIPPTVLSRCQTFEFKPLEVEDIVKRLEFVIAQEGISATSEDKQSILEALAINAEGSIRDALISLEQLAILGDGKIHREHLNEVLGVVESDLLSKTLRLIKQKATKELLDIVAQLVEKGRNLERYVKNFIKFLRDILIIKSGGQVTLYSLAQSRYEELKKQAEDYNYPFLLNLLNNFFELEEQLKSSSHPRFLLEFTFIKLTAIEPAVELDQVISAIEKWRLSPEARVTPPDEVTGEESADKPEDFFGQPVETERSSIDAADASGMAVQPGKAGIEEQEPVHLTAEQELWAQLLQLLEKHKAVLAHSIEEDCQLIGVENDVVKIAVRKNAHSEYIFKMLMKKDNKELIDSALREITGRDLRVNIVFVDKEEPQEGATPAVEETVETDSEDSAEMVAAEEGGEDQSPAPGRQELSQVLEESLKETEGSPKLTLNVALKKNPELKQAVNLIEDLFQAKIIKLNDKPIK